MSNKPLDQQVGGSHYKDLAIQPIVFCQANELNACESNIVKYVCRHKQKGRMKDLEKVIHYAQMLIELEYGGVSKTTHKVADCAPVPLDHQDEQIEKSGVLSELSLDQSSPQLELALEPQELDDQILSRPPLALMYADLLYRYERLVNCIEDIYTHSSRKEGRPLGLSTPVA